MSASSSGSPKSSLAAARAVTVPWGLSPRPASPVGGRPATREPPAHSPGVATGGNAATPRLRTVSAVSPVRSTRSRSANEERLIALLVATAAGVTIALVAFGARMSLSLTASEAQIGTMLGRASLQQMEFHTQHSRFALWGELAETGATLPASVTVVRSNATASHWYLQLRDQATGMTCDRVGQLIDPPSAPAPPSCTRAP